VGKKLKARIVWRAIKYKMPGKPSASPVRAQIAA
jgi:hypothetical protein